MSYVLLSAPDIEAPEAPSEVKSSTNPLAMGPSLSNEEQRSKVENTVAQPTKKGTKKKKETVQKQKKKTRTKKHYEL